jgi:hypothetical protein
VRHVDGLVKLKNASEVMLTSSWESSTRKPGQTLEYAIHTDLAGHGSRAI